MRAKKLSERLAVMAEYISAGESVADIGADHGYLPQYLVREGISPFAILTDVNAGPLEKTRISIERAALGGNMELRLGNGLSVLGEGEVDVVVVAGMGGETMVTILAEDEPKTRTFKKIILQPRTKPDVLKEWLFQNKYKIIAEKTAFEKGRLCDIIVCMPEAA